MNSHTFHSSVRPIVTYGLALTLIVGFILGKIPSDTFSSISISVISYWFGQRGAETSKQTKEG